MITWDILEFCAWLREKSGLTVGSSQSWFRSPISRYLREKTGQPYYVDESSYGPMACDVQWSLPGWVKDLNRRLNSQPNRMFTGEQVIWLLPVVERR